MGNRLALRPRVNRIAESAIRFYPRQDFMMDADGG